METRLYPTTATATVSWNYITIIAFFIRVPPPVSTHRLKAVRARTLLSKALVVCHDLTVIVAAQTQFIIGKHVAILAGLPLPVAAVRLLVLDVLGTELVLIPVEDYLYIAVAERRCIVVVNGYVAVH